MSDCEDVSSIELLTRFVDFCVFVDDVSRALDRTLAWGLFNQVPDDGFAFRLTEARVYGCPKMRSS